MAAVGLVRVVQVARAVAETVLPSDRSTYAKHLVIHPSLLAMLCLMRYDDWTLREAAVRRGAHQELRTAREVSRGCRTTRQSSASCGVSTRRSCGRY